MYVKCCLEQRFRSDGFHPDFVADMFNAVVSRNIFEHWQQSSNQEA